MTKYVAQRATHKGSYHVDPECTRLHKDPKEATKNELEWHELTPCPRCCE